MSKTDLIKKIISKGESKQLEFKELLDKTAIAKTACSFLNAEGGQILIGVMDNKSIAGIKNAVAETKILSDFLINQIVPESPVNVFVEKIENKSLIVVEVIAGSKQPYVFQGAIYVRKGVKTSMANSADVTSLMNKREEANLHWERQTTVGADLDDLDLSEIKSSIREIDKTGKGNPNLSGDMIEFLEYYGLYKNGRITNAAMLMFGSEPAKFIPQCRVRITIFRQNKVSSEYSYDKVLESNIFKVVKQVEEFFEINLGSVSTFRKSSWQRQDKLRYPKQALREGVLNAIIHRDYKNSSGSVLIGIYPDRFEISNYGGLPPDWKPQDLKVNHLSLPRNPDLAHMFYMKGYIEKIGRGTILIIDETTKMGFKEPTWSVKTSVTTLTFPGITALIKGKQKGGVNEDISEVITKVLNENVSEAVKLRLVDIVNFIYANKGIKVSDLIKQFDISERTIKDNLKLLIDLGLVIYTGSKKAGAYTLTKSVQDKLQG